jgi:uncharacterized membrane protein YedE/YeeE
MSLLARCPSYVAGPLLGLLIVGLRAAVNKPFGAMGGFIELSEKTFTPGKWGLPAFILLGLVAGGSAYALLVGRFALDTHYSFVWPVPPSLQPIVVVAAGVAMGFGARLAGGCTSGHGLCGISLGSTASIVATMTFFGTAVMLTNVLVWLVGR